MRFNPKEASLPELKREIEFVEEQMFQCRCWDIREDLKKILKEYKHEYEKRRVNNVTN